MLGIEKQFYTYLKASPSKTGVKGSLKVWHSEMAVSKRPAWTKRVTISSADELPVEAESYSVRPTRHANERNPKTAPVVNAQDSDGALHTRVAHHICGPATAPAAGAQRPPATATTAGSCWARVRRMRAKEHSFSRSSSSRISICLFAVSQRKTLSMPKAQRKCLLDKRNPSVSTKHQVTFSLILRRWGENKGLNKTNNPASL